MGLVAWLVGHFYPILVPVVLLVFAYVIVLKRQRSLLIPFVIALVCVSAVFYLMHWWPIFFISLPSVAGFNGIRTGWDTTLKSWRATLRLYFVLQRGKPRWSARNADATQGN